MAWLLPTYRRPKRCAQVIEQIKRVGVSSPGVVFVQGYDGMDEYRKIQLPDGWTWFWSAENIGVCGAMQTYFMNNPDDKYYGLICDDEMVYTPRWDERIIRAAGRINIAHGNDGWQSDKRLHTFCCYGGDLVRHMQFWALPGLWHWYFDDVWETVAAELGLKRHCVDVRTEHLHYVNGAAQKDMTYQAGEMHIEAGKAAFEHWKANVWPQQKADFIRKYSGGVAL